MFPTPFIYQKNVTMKKNKLVKITTRLDDWSIGYEIQKHGDYVYFRSYIDEEHPTEETEIPLDVFKSLMSQLNLDSIS